MWRGVVGWWGGVGGGGGGGGGCGGVGVIVGGAVGEGVVGLLYRYRGWRWLGVGGRWYGSVRYRIWGGWCDDVW